MDTSRLSELTTIIERFAENRPLPENSLGIVPGTGWKQGIGAVFKQQGEFSYKDLYIPGSDLEVEGHKKGLKWGQIGDQNVILIGRVHANENITDPNLRQAMSLLIGGLRNHLDGLLITNGVGTLHGEVPADKDDPEFNRNEFIHNMARAMRGRAEQTIKVGDIAIVDDIKTALVGPLTPLGAGEFIDFYHNGIHRDDDLYFKLVKEAVARIQGRCPLAQSRFIAGPQFEGPADKVEFKSQGDDVIGMSGIQEVLAATQHGVPFAQIVLATNGPFGSHSHEGNQNVGAGNQEKAAEILTEIARAWPHRSA